MKKTCFILMVGLAALIAPGLCQAQTPPPLPAMYVEKNTGNERIMRFSQIPNSKYQQLSKLNSYQDLFFIYTRNAMDQLVQLVNRDKGVRIYFARYNKCDGSSLPTEIEENKVIVLFASESKDPKATPSKYYFLNEKGADDRVYEVSQACGEAWIYDYGKNVLPELLNTLTPGDRDNIDPYVPGVYSDSKSIFFTAAMFKEAFVDEEKYDHKIGGVPLTISAFKLSFSAYDAKGNGGAGMDVYRNRLFIQFDYMHNPGTGNEVFHLDDLDDFKDRPKPAKMQQQKQGKKSGKNKKGGKKEHLFSLDNGQLCPTHCPPPPPPPPL